MSAAVKSAMDATVTQNLHHSFVELENLEEYEAGGVLKWVERARWIKLEEDVDVHTNQWSAPYIPVLSFKALVELKSCLQDGVVCIGMKEKQLSTISRAMVCELVNKNLVEGQHMEELNRILLARHKHIRRKMDAPAIGQKWLSTKAHILPRRNTIVSVELQSVSNLATLNEDTESISSLQAGRLIDISNKLPSDTEVTIILTAQLEMFKHPVAVFVRLDEAAYLGNLTEVRCPVRFVCLIAGSASDITSDYLQLGRCFGTLMSDSRFLTLAYLAEVGNDLLSGIDRFLDESVILPPGDWQKQNFKQSIPKWEALTSKPSPAKLSLKSKRTATFGVPASMPVQMNQADPLARTGTLFGCLRRDIRRKVSHYVDDFMDIFDIRCLAAILFIYLAALAPTITFGGLMSQQTNENLGISEMILAGGSAGIVFALLSGQPLIIVGPTGPMLIMETNIFVLANSLEVEYLPWRVWIGIWVTVICLIVIAFDLCVLVRMVTRFTEEIFAVLVSVIFIQKAISFIYKTFRDHPISNHHPPQECSHLANSTYLLSLIPNNSSSNTSLGATPNLEHPCYSLMTAILIIMTFILAFYFRKIRRSRYFSLKIRHIISDFGVIIAVGLVVLFDYSLSDNFTKKLSIKKDYFSRNWFINPLGIKSNLPIGYMFLAILPAFLVSIIIIIETGITAIILDKKENKFRKGFGYHLDLLVIGSLAAASGITGLPWMCASPVNSMSHFHTLTVLSSTHAPGTNPHVVKVKEQRVTNIMIHLMIGGSVLLTPMLERIPVAVLFGVFLYLGFTSLARMEFVHRLKLMFIPYKLHPDTRFVRKVQTKKIHFFTFIQLSCLVILAIVKETKVAAIFPFLILCLVPLRRFLRVFFTEEELEDLDNQEGEDEFAVSDEFEEVHIPL